MNAHIDRDVPFALEKTSQYRRLFSHFNDYNRVGRILVNAVDDIQEELIRIYPERAYEFHFFKNRFARIIEGVGILGIREKAWEFGSALHLSQRNRKHPRLRDAIARLIEKRANFIANRLRNFAYDFETESQVPEPLP